MKAVVYVNSSGLLYDRDQFGELKRQQRRYTWHLAPIEAFGNPYVAALCGMSSTRALGQWTRICMDATFNGRFDIRLCQTCADRTELRGDPERNDGERVELDGESVA